MHWALVTAGALGLTLGFCFRIPSMAAATAVALLATAAAGLGGSWPADRILLAALQIVVTLQAAYLAGAVLSRWLRRN